MLHQITGNSSENTYDASHIFVTMMLFKPLREMSKNENLNLPKQGSVSFWLRLFGHPVRETAPAVTSALMQNNRGKMA